MPDLTPCEYDAAAGWWAKRDDLACYDGPAWPSGAKVRQYAAMIAAAPADAVLAIGCAAASAMQVYVAGMQRLTGRPAYVVVPARLHRHPSTRWAIEAGALVEEVRPGYPNQYKARLRALLRERGLQAVPWDRRAAALDTAAQVANLPAEARSVVVPSGSGLTAAGVIGGLHLAGSSSSVTVVATSGLGTPEAIRGLVARYFGDDVYEPIPVTYVAPTCAYDSPRHGLRLPDGTPLDPWYAAKAMRYCQPGDVLWVTGRRPDGAIK